MFNLPSPIQKINKSVFSEHGIEVYIKRDDLIHPYVSGNKLRKLKGWIETAKEQGANTLVTFGGAYSNHLIATAYASTVLGFKSIGIVRGEEAPDNLVLKHCRLFGMEIQYAGREEYRNKSEFFDKHFGGSKNHIYVPEGGGGEPGTWGFKEFLEEPNIEADYYVLAAGTGTSAYGIAKNLASNESAKVVAIACVKDYSIEELYSPNLEFNFNYAGKGFGKFDDNLVEFAKNEFKEIGVLFDPVYTAKSWNGLLDLTQKGFFKRGGKVIFVHTGGLTGWWSI